MTGPAQVVVDIATTSQVMPTPKATPQPPKITLNGNPFPQPPGPGSPSGFQVVVIDLSMDMTNPASVRFNEYLNLYPDSQGYWSDTYAGMYNWIMRSILSAGDPQTQRLFVVSYGMDEAAPPTPDALQLLLGYGAGPQLQKWETSADIGSENGWVGTPACYILVGAAGDSYGLGAETFQTGGTNVQASVSVTLGNP